MNEEDDSFTFRPSVERPSEYALRTVSFAVSDTYLSIPSVETRTSSSSSKSYTVYNIQVYLFSRSGARQTSLR